MSQVILCDLCGKRVPPHTHYVVKIDIYADPSMPATTTDELEEKDFDTGMKDLIEQMKSMTPDELQDQVHRRFEFKLCRGCQTQFLANPLGHPRGIARTGEN